MSIVKAVVLRSAGTNCEQEAVHALRRAGAEADLVHLREFIERPDDLRRYGIVCFPGGFSFGDDVASGVVYSVLMREKVTPALRRLVADGGLVIGICNGFQILTRAGLLPDTRGDGAPEATLLWNESNQFECRWVRLQATTDRCAWLQPGQTIDCPVAHGEGRFVVADPTVRTRMLAAGQMALRYVGLGGSGGDATAADAGSDPACVGAPRAGSGGSAVATPDLGRIAPGTSVPYPWNPNGSPDDIAGVCDPTGRVLGLMPHPERNVETWHHPRWTRGEGGEATIGLAVFRNGVRAAGR